MNIKHILLACMKVSCAEYPRKMIGPLERVEVKDFRMRVKSYNRCYGSASAYFKSFYGRSYVGVIIFTLV